MALKKTSEVITISGDVTETAANTFTELTVDLPLSPLDNEVFIVLAADMDVNSPDAIAGTNTAIQASLSTTSRTSVGGLGDSNAFAVTSRDIQADGFADGGVGFMKLSPETPQASLDYIAIISTDDCFCQIDGTNNNNPKKVNFKLYGYRARADAATYAALVQSELLSN